MRILSGPLSILRRFADTDLWQPLFFPACQQAIDMMQLFIFQILLSVNRLCLSMQLWMAGNSDYCSKGI